MRESFRAFRRTLSGLLEQASARREAGRHVRMAFDQAAIPLAICDFEGRMTHVNRSMCALLGRPSQRLLGASFQEFTHPDHRGNDLEPLEQVLSGKTAVYVREKRYVHADGHSIWAEVSVTLARLPSGRPSHFVVQVRDISERRGYEEELRRMADQDPLTGLRNRRSFEGRLSDHIAHIERYGATGAVLMIDLDNFKYQNDTHGHGVGDELLSAVATRLESRLRASDVVGRHGGDEFVVLLPDASRTQAEVVASKLIEQINATALMAELDATKPIGASVGIVCFEETGPLPVDSTLVYADRALYQAKHAGRNRFVVYDTTGVEDDLITASRGS